MSMVIYINKNALIDSISFETKDFNDKIEEMLNDMFDSRSFLEFESLYPQSYKFFSNNYLNDLVIDDDMTFEDVTYEVLLMVADDEEDLEGFDEIEFDD